MTKRNVRYLDATGARSSRGQTQIRFKNSKKSSGSNFGKFLYWLAFLAFIGVIAYALFFSQFLTITQIEVLGTRKLNPDEIRVAAKSRLSGNWLNFVPKNNILLAGENYIKKTFLGKYKYMAGVEIKKDFPHKISIIVRERDLGLVFCSGGKCHVAEKNGTIFTEADFEKNELGEREMTALFNDGGANLSVSQALDSDYIGYLLGIREKIKNDLGVDLEREFHTPQMASGDIRAKTAEGWQIYFDKSIPLSKEIEMLKAVLENKIDPNRRSDLEYIDLRTNNKVYYKFKQLADKELIKSE